MKGFEPYVQKLETLLFESLRNGLSNQESILAALDGQPRQEIRRLIPIEELRAAGAFFTGHHLAAAAAGWLLKDLRTTPLILDPACGVGDLLTACSQHLPISDTLDSTLCMWGNVLSGHDLQPTFVRAAKIRLALVALQRGLPIMPDWSPKIEELFPKITQNCGITDQDALSNASHIIVNPPFTIIDSPKDCSWGSGKVSEAAVFLESCVIHAKKGTKIVAILPDVLRSGWRYRKWRERIEEKTNIRRIRLFDRFDNYADIHVFLIEFIITNGGKKGLCSWHHPSQSLQKTVGHFFDVCVGTVVQYRDPQRGPMRPFVSVPMLPAWETVHKIRGYRQYSGRTFKAPFVAVRRTSRPEDPNRAVASIITDDRPAAVDNHLIVLQPKDRSLETCKKLVSVFAMPQTNRWLNQRIRCRHLTILSLSELPWWEQTK